MKILTPFKMVGRYADGTEIYKGGSNEEDCMYKLLAMVDEHGKLEWYSAVNDEDYIDGEYVGCENFYY